MSTHLATTFNPLSVLEYLERVPESQNQKQYEVIVTEIQAAKDRTQAASTSSKCINRKVLENKDAESKVRELTKEGYDKAKNDGTGCPSQSTINMEVLKQVHFALEARFTCALGYTVARILNDFDMLCKTSERGERNIRHQLIFNDLFDLQLTIEEYKASTWGWTLEKGFENIVNEIQPLPDVYNLNEGLTGFRQSWELATRAIHLVKELSDIFLRLRKIDVVDITEYKKIS